MKHNTLKSLLSDIAAQIKLKTGDTSPIAAADFPQAIMDIEVGDDPPEYDWDCITLPEGVMRRIQFSKNKIGTLLSLEVDNV